MFIAFAILFVIFLYFAIGAIDEFVKRNKFKEGYTFDTYELVFHTTKTYKLISTYKIEANRDGYILVQDRTNGKFGAFSELKIMDLLYSTDKIIIKNENGEEVETFFKLNPYS